MELELLLRESKSSTPSNAVHAERDELPRRYDEVRRTTQWICAPLTIEDCVIQSAMECSPVKWQLAHTTWFFETFVLLPHDPTYREFHPTFSYLFNSYYNAVGTRTPRDMRGLMSRPTLAEVWDYREHVDRAMNAFLKHASENAIEQANSIIVLGLNHEQQHQELIITDVKTILAMNPLRPVYRAREITSTPVAPWNWIAFDEGIYEVGASGTEFYFDNEGPRHRQYIESYELADRLVTNGEYKEFISDGAYQNPAIWLSDGWAKVLEEKWQAPKYWEEQDGEWWAMTLQGFRPVEDSEPVTHISHYEADAFATWSGARLPTEFEWELAARDVPTEGNFLEEGNFHPVVQTSVCDSARGSQTKVCATQMFGDTWEWTRSAYLPYPGYKAAEGAIGEYNGKFMSNQIVLRGGSCVTPRDHIRATYRNFFPPESRWQFSGIRLARDRK
ncbi:MAG TPA: ergothioneine biosynthesis protein EgtB [Candidatus Kapabacteria bacterium]|nr:ergothioneine biosynthesis protein EgtB [Candidatus Kapabacteria bacterium]